MATKQPFSRYTPLINGNRSIEESISEIQREMDVRKRLFDKWVAEGRMSWVDAHDRLERQCSALKWMIAYSNSLDQAQPPNINPAFDQAEPVSVNSLDHAAEADA